MKDVTVGRNKELPAPIVALWAIGPDRSTRQAVLDVRMEAKARLQSSLQVYEWLSSEVKPLRLVHNQTVFAVKIYNSVSRPFVKQG